MNKATNQGNEIVKGDTQSPMTAFIPLLAYILDLLMGDPDWLYKKIWHPVIVPGKLANWFERTFNKGRSRSPHLMRGPSNSSNSTQIWTPDQVRRSIINGFVCAVLILTFIFVLTLLITKLTRSIPYMGWVVEVLIASSLIAHNSLAKFVSNVGTSLKSGGLDEGQKAVQHLVSRKADKLDESGVCRSAIESLSENYCDAVVAPLFWFVVFSTFGHGLAGLALYKTINTLDSMWGYRSERYEYFGKFAARLDDVANWVPARLSALIVLITANKWGSISNVLKNAPLHRSPNAGWPESAFAYVVGIKLSGPRVYGEGIYDGPWMGDGREVLTPSDIDKAVALFHKTTFVTLPLLALSGITQYLV